MAIMQSSKGRHSASGASSSKMSANDRSRGDQTSDEVSWIDPVCGMSVKRLSAFFTAEHEGVTYRFCSEACRSAFEKEPSRHARAASTEESAE